MNQKTFYFIICFFSFFFGIGQDKDFQNFTTEEGLPSNEVYSLFQDKNGTMWFATDRGLSQYNGYEFKNFEPKDGLTDITVFDFFPQENGQVWCSTFNKKIFYFQNGTSHFVPYKYNAVIVKYLSDHKIATFLIKDIVSTRNGDLYLTDGALFFKISHKGILTEFNIGNKVKARLRLPQYLTSASINKKQTLFYLSYTKNKYELPNGKGYLRSMFSLSNGNKLIVLDSVVRIYRKDKLLRDISYKNYTATGSNEFGANSFWVGFRGKGARIYDAEGNLIEEFLKNNTVTKVKKDSYGGLWVASADAGVFYKRANQIKNFYFENSRVHSLTSDQNKSLFIGAFNGNVYQKNYKSTVRKIYDGPLNTPSQVQYHASFKTTFCYSDNTTLTFPKNNKYPNIGAVLKISDDNPDELGFIQYGIYTILKKDKTTSDTLYHRIHDISSVDNKLYLGTIDGLKVFENGKISKMKHDLFKYRIDDIDFVPSKGIFYMATLGKGVLVYNKSTDKVYAIDKAKGLSNDIVTEVFVENENTIWACTNYGVNRIRFKGDQAYTVDYITSGNGLLSNQVQDVEVIDDSVYVGTTKGLCAFSKRQFAELISEKKYFLRVKEILVNDTPFLESYTKLELKHHQNQLDFFVEAVSFSLKKNIVYQYKLEGLDNTWKNTNDRKISYEYIPPGNYKLLVKVLEDGRLLSKERIEIPIYISKPFWKTFWFLGFLGSAVAAIIYFFFKIRVLSYNEDIVRELLRLIMKRIKRADNYFSFKEAGKEVRVKTSDILFIQSSGNYIDIVTETKTYTVREKIGDFTKLVSDPLEFLRVHRSYIVRIDKINKKSKKAVYINTQEIPVGETYVSELDKIVF